MKEANNMKRSMEKSVNKSMKKGKLTYSNFYFYLLLILPILIAYVLFFAIPVVSSMVFSFTNFNGINLKFKWMGLGNYEVAFHDKVFLKAMVNTFLFALGAMVLQNVLAVMFALALNTKIRSRGILRVMIFAPCMLSPVVVAFIWQFIYMPDGVLNKILGTHITWLGNTKTALICVVIAHVWMWIGYSATIYMSNLQNISEDILEAASIDGAGGFQRFKRIVLPMLAPATTINVTLAFTQSLKVFDIVYAMTNGGPRNATETVGTYVVVNMNRGLHGFASAQTVLLTIVIVFFGQVLIGFLKKREEAVY